MDFTKLFPPSAEPPSEEKCTLGEETIVLDAVRFEKIVPGAIPPATFIDGGSAILFSTPARVFGIIKVALVKTKELQRNDVTVHEYLVSITRTNDTFTVRAQNFGIADVNIAAAIEKEFPADVELPEQLFDTVRTLAEYAAAPEGVVILDGSLRTTNMHLQNEQPPHACALAKTTALLTSKQRPLGMALLTRAPPGVWSANLTARERSVRLHAQGSHTFLLEGNVNQNVLSLLHAWSADMSFPGYPYPLILADQLARVTNNERDAWRMILSSDGQAAKILTDEMKAGDAHAMLEHILYGKEP